MVLVLASPVSPKTSIAGNSFSAVLFACAAQPCLALMQQNVNLIASRQPFLGHLRGAVFIKSLKPPKGSNECGHANHDQRATKDPKRSFPRRFSQGPANQASTSQRRRAIEIIQYFQAIFTAVS